MRKLRERPAELLRYYSLLQHRFEFVVDDKRLVDPFVFSESLDDVASNLERFRKIDASLAGYADVFTDQAGAAPAEEISALASDRQDLNLLVRDSRE